MKRCIKTLQAVSPTDGQTILGRLRPAACQVIPEWVRNPARKGLLLPNPLAAMPGAHQSAALFHAMRLTSRKRSLQSP
jgi:hypothetical protein